MFDNNNLNSIDSSNINLIHNLTKYMLTREVVNNSLSYLVDMDKSNYLLCDNGINNNYTNNNSKNNLKSNNLYKNPELLKNKNPFFIPRQKDSLFWCFYIMKNGIEKYEMIDFINIVVEKNLKIEYIEKLRQKKELLKIYKFATLTHIENVLLNEYKIDMKTFLSLCALENINVLFINKKTFFELEMNTIDYNSELTITKSIHILHFFPDKNNYGLENDISKLKIDEYKNKLYKITNSDKPIRAISAYKSEELVEICIKLGIETFNKEKDKTFLKKELYEEIIKELS